MRLGEFVPWDHPIRLEAEEAVERYHEFAQAHLPSDNKRYLAQLFIDFAQRQIDNAGKERGIEL